MAGSFRSSATPGAPVRVLLIHQAFASPSEGGGTRHYELGQRLRKRGHELTIVASTVSYLTGNSLGVKRDVFTEQNLDGLRVLRARAYTGVHRGVTGRVLSFVTFAISSVIAGLRAGPVDIVMGTSPSISQALSAWVIAVCKRRPFVLEIRDLWPQALIDAGLLRNAFLIWFTRQLERFLYARSCRIIVNSPAYRDYLIANGIAASNISFISNGVDPEMFDPDSGGETVRQTLNLDAKFVISYTGAIGFANDIGTVLQAAAYLQESNIVFLLAGNGNERANLEDEARKRELKNIIFLGGISKSEVSAVLAASDACLAILKDTPMHRTTYPNKVFDYMAAGRPTILAIDGAIRRVIEASKGGIFVSPGNARALADAVLTLRGNPTQAREMGQRARAYVIKHFNRDTQGAEFVSLIERLVGQEHQPEAAFCTR